MLLLSLLLTGCTREGTVGIEDCPETITVTPQSFPALTRTFICNYTKTQSGKVLSGVCRSRDTYAFTGKCRRLYEYEVPSDVQCWGEHDNPTLDDTCVCDVGYSRNSKTSKCEACPDHSHTNAGACSCDNGYWFDFTAPSPVCVPQP